MLRTKEKSEALERQKEEERKRQAFQQKYNLQNQMHEREQQRREAFEEYVKEKDQVNQVIEKMIREDQEAANMVRAK